MTVIIISTPLLINIYPYDAIFTPQCGIEDPLIFLLQSSFTATPIVARKDTKPIFNLKSIKNARKTIIKPIIKLTKKGRRNIVIIKIVIDWKSSD